ncbi:MAG: hypothetical protein ACI8W3_001307 [Myxococcota bacterium]
MVRHFIASFMLIALSAHAAQAEKQLLWGDTHLHTSNSFDAYLNLNTSADPETAYRFAKGLPVIHPYHRARVQLETPLDFLVIADHAEYLGVIRTVGEGAMPKDDLGPIDGAIAFFAEWWLERLISKDEGGALFASILPDTNDVRGAAADAAENERPAIIPGETEMAKSTWEDAGKIADAHNEPGTFTALIGWEWSAVPAGSNLHRVVFTSANANTAALFRPFSSVDSMYPEDLWAWLETTAEASGAEFVAIPHNSNVSKGFMFDVSSLRGAPMTREYAELRQRWEPVVEATQYKGDSETHPALSPNDPFADFETYTHYIQQNAPEYIAGKGDFVRSALRRGLELEREIGVNPYRFGLIGSTDSHTGLATAEEPNFWGKFARDSIPENKQNIRPGSRGRMGWSMSASGLAAAWASENTRDGVMAAFKRKEVYATTGPRIGVRVFADFTLGEADLSRPASELEAAGAVVMGGVLGRAAGTAAPRLLIHATKDQRGANLDRVQVVKGWLDATGQSRERVYDVAWSDERIPDANGQLPAVGNTVDPVSASYTNDIGAAQLSTVWFDPAFNADQAAFYYVRVLEIPTPRHSTFDALALGLDATTTGKPWFIQERAYTSPIWYAPR